MGWRPGRLELDGENTPVTVADGDRVMVVPITQAKLVVNIARDIANHDKARRSELYQKAGLKLDDIVEPLYRGKISWTMKFVRCEQQRATCSSQ